MSEQRTRINVSAIFPRNKKFVQTISANGNPFLLKFNQEMQTFEITEIIKKEGGGKPESGNRTETVPSIRSKPEGDVLATPHGEIMLCRDLSIVFEPYNGQDSGKFLPSIKINTRFEGMLCRYAEKDWEPPRVNDPGSSLDTVLSLIEFRDALESAASNAPIREKIGGKLLAGISNLLYACSQKYFQGPNGNGTLLP